MDLTREATVIATYRTDLVNGRVFALHANSHGSRLGYKPPVNREKWAQVVTSLGAMARESDRLAQVAAAVLPKLNLYGTDASVCESLYTAVFGAVKAGYDNVIERSGPEPDRFRKTPFTVRECILISRYCDLATHGMTNTASSEGWVRARVAHDEGMMDWQTWSSYMLTRVR